MTPPVRWPIVVGVRFMVVAAALALAGCYAPTVTDGLPCGQGSACPPGQSCDTDQRCRIRLLDGGSSDVSDADPEPDVASDDLDDDGVLNASDNCPTDANSDQEDHDADAIGDVCDNCPHVANPAQAVAMDADLVGDACDPNQGRIDTLARFEGFYGIPSGWTLPAGWTVTNGKLAATVATGFQFAYLNANIGADLTIVSAASMVPGTGTPNVGVLAHLTLATAQYHRCAVVAGAPGRAEISLNTGANFTTIDQINYVAPSFTDSAMSMDVTGGTITCAARAGLETANLAGTNTGAGGTRIGLRVREATGAFDYVVIFTH